MTTVSAAGRTFEVYNPATEELIDVVPDVDAVGASAAIDVAAAVQPAWAAMAPRQRSEILRSTFDLMREEAESLATMIVTENGKTLADARGEVGYAAEFFRWFAEEAVRIDGSLTLAPSGDKRIMVQHQPVGVAALVTPWNFPIAMATRKIAPALAAGCAVVLKPAAETPLSAIAIGELCRRAGVPDGVVQVVTSTRSAVVVNAWLEDDRVRALSFTGSTEVGRTLLAGAARRVVNTSMELGGNAPVIVCDDADLDVAVEQVMIAKMRNGGAACTAANRIIVHESIADDFTARLAAAMGALRVGPGLDESNHVGALVSASERRKVDELVASAIDAGAVPTVGGDPHTGKGHFVQPTVLSAVQPDHDILNQEIFGPVAPIVKYTNDDEAISLANRTPHGLIGYVFSSDLSRALSLGERLDAGMIGINRGLVSDPAAPFGGWKQSGIGREGGHVGIHEFLETKYMAVQW